MMADLFIERMEQQRLELEENIAKLRISLRYWQTVEIDYEGLKEEFMILPNDASYDDCLQAARDFVPEVVDEKEIVSLLGPKSSGGRRPPQLIDLLSKRGDYVIQNVETLRKQLSNAEKKRNALLLVGDPEHREEAGLPLTEITEELDESGQVVSSKIDTPAEDIPQLIKSLKSSGVNDLEVEDSKDERTVNSDGQSSHESDLDNGQSEQEFNTRVGHDFGLQSEKAAQGPSNATKQAVISSSPGPGTTYPVPQKAVTTRPDDTEEEAALRQEMHSYGLEDVGAIVAELELAEGASDVSVDDENEDFDIESDYDENDDIDDDDDDSEDESGKSKQLRISSKYRQKMEELHKKLGIEEMENLGPTPDLPAEVQSQLDRPSAAEAAKIAAIAREDANKKTSLKTKKEKSPNRPVVKSAKQKKKVAFANSLDIANEPNGSKSLNTSNETSTNDIPRPIGDEIVERTSSTNPSNAQPPNQSKPSIFKKTRTSKPQTPMFPPPVMDFPDPASHQSQQGPADKVISDTLIERLVDKGSSTAPPPDPSDIDEEMHRREIAMEYYKMRNKRIYQQGGFIGDGEDDNYGDEFAPIPVEDESTGKTRKVSRFKAARVKS